MSEITILSLKRFIQISLVISFGCWLWLYFHIEKGYWIPFTISLLYGVIDEGAVSARMKDRVFGTFFGILICQVLIFYGLAHPVLSYPLYFILLFFIFLTIKTYLVAVTFITAIVLWSNTFIAVGDVNVEHLSYDRLLNTLIAALLCYGSEFIFRTYRHTEHLIYEYARTLHLQYINYVSQCFQTVLTNNNFDRKEQIRKMRANDLELRRLLQWVPHSFSKRFSNKSIAYQQAVQELRNIRSNILVIEYIARHYPSQLKSFYNKNNKSILKIFLLFNVRKFTKQSEIEYRLNNLKQTSELEYQLVEALRSLVLKNKDIWHYK